MTNNWRPGLPVTRLNFDIPGSGGTWPPVWWRRWGKTVFIIGGIVGWVLLLCALVARS